jgi:hypothetical protein
LRITPWMRRHLMDAFKWQTSPLENQRHSVPVSPAFVSLCHIIAI